MSDITYCASNCCNTNCIRQKLMEANYLQIGQLSTTKEDAKANLKKIKMDLSI